MKKTNLLVLLAVGALGVTALATKLAATPATPLTPAACTMASCCGGAVAEPMADEAKAQPDLLTTCPVSGDKLGEEGMKPFTFAYKGQEVKLCCKSCKKDFDKDPEKYIKLIRAADKK